MAQLVARNKSTYQNFAVAVTLLVFVANDNAARQTARRACSWKTANWFTATVERTNDKGVAAVRAVLTISKRLAGTRGRAMAAPLLTMPEWTTIRPALVHKGAEMQRAKRVAGAVLALVVGLWALAALPIVPVAAQEDEELQWFGDLTDGRAILAYGIPESDYVPLSMMCDQGEREITIFLEYEAVTAKVGDEVSVRLKAGDADVVFPAVGEPQEMDDLLHLKGHAKLDAPFQAVLAAAGDLTIEVETARVTYPLKGAAEAAGHLIETCSEKQAAAGEGLAVTVTNAAKLPLQSFSYSRAGVNSFDSDTFGYEPLAPGASRTFTIPDGHSICTFDVAVLFVEDEEECCSDPLPVGTQNLCEDSEFTVKDLPAASDPWVGTWNGDGLSATIRRGTAKPEFVVIDLVTGAEGCSGAVTLYGKPDGKSVAGASYDPADKEAPLCKVDISIGDSGEMEAATAGPCSYYHGAACGFDGKLVRSE
jgi:hypothetical protein